jgi:LDH2 family malate/lactate/ureidoglycolate dehydrogenase
MPASEAGPTSEVILKMSDIVLVEGARFHETILLRGLDLTVRFGERLLIAYDDESEAQAFLAVTEGRRQPTSGTLWRHKKLLPCFHIGKETMGSDTTIQLVPLGSTPVLPSLVLSSGRLKLPDDSNAKGAATFLNLRVVQDAASKCLYEAGLPLVQAKFVAHVLCDADERGHTSHGIGLLPIYIERLKLGGIDPNAIPQWLWQTDILGCIDANGAIGQHAANLAAHWVADHAKGHGLAAVGIRNNNHVGMLAAYREAFQSKCVLGLLMNISGVSVVPPGGSKPSLGSNALCLVTPTSGGEPFCIDMATGVVAAGKIREAAALGRSIPRDWLLDATGTPTTDPSSLDKGGMIPVFGGYKGLGVHLIVEILAGMVAGNTTSTRVHKQRSELDQAMQCSQLFIGLDPARFGIEDTNIFIRELCAAVMNGYSADDLPSVYFPDQLEAVAKQRATREGIRVSPEVQRCLTSNK